MTVLHNSITGNSIRFLSDGKRVEKCFSEPWRHEREREVLGTLLRGHSFAPEVYLDASDSAERCLVMECIAGIPLSAYLAAHPSSTIATSARLGTMIRVLHSHRFDAETARTSLLPRRNRKHFEALFDGLPAILGASRLALNLFLDEHGCYLEESGFVLLHRDISMSNVIIRNADAAPALVDFENCAWGHPFADIWRFLEVESGFGKAAVQAFWHTYFNDVDIATYQRSFRFMETAFALEMCALYLRKEITLTAPMHIFVAALVRPFGIKMEEASD